jgi:hypothetical protein
MQVLASHGNELINYPAKAVQTQTRERKKVLNGGGIENIVVGGTLKMS